MRASRGLKWENKMHKLKRSIAILAGYVKSGMIDIGMMESRKHS